MPFHVEAIGHVHAARRQPRDDNRGGEIARIQLVPGFSAESLQGLADFSHAEVLFLLHQIGEETIARATRHPRGNPNWPAVGIFAQRGRNRPNRIGATICRIVCVEGTALEVAELDAIEGTPVLDIKPVMQEFLPREPVRQPQWSRELMASYWLKPEV